MPVFLLLLVLISSANANEVLDDNKEILSENNPNDSIKVGSYTYLQKLIDNSTDDLTLDGNITFDAEYDLSPDNPYYGKVNFTNGVIINKTLKINGATFTINGNNASRIFNIISDDCVLNNINFINGRNPGYGAAVYSTALNTNITNCNFTDNIGCDYGGAIYFEKKAYVSYSNFKSNQVEKNKVTRASGGAIYFKNEGKVFNTNFEDNSALYSGGAVYFASQATLENCNFTRNNAVSSGATYFASQANVITCNFNANYARSSGAAYFSSTANVTNSNFSNNYATNDNGGAASFNQQSNVINCTFMNNTAKLGRGGAIHFEKNSIVENCNFTKNSADTRGGAVDFAIDGTIINSNFLNNSGDTGGGAYIKGIANIIACNFINNTARQKAGAVLIGSAGTVKKSYFTDNKAKGASAIEAKDSLEISNSTFMNNKAESTALILTKIDKAVNITFEGNDNLLNAIYSDAEITFKNVTYWGAQGIMNTDNSGIIKSNNEAGQNITIKVYVDDALVSQTTEITDENGSIFFNPGYDNYLVEVLHEDDSYYTEISNSTIVGKLEPKIIIETENTTVGKSELINITVNGEKNDNITAYINSEKYPVNNGIIIFTPLKEGDYNVIVFWDGNDDYVAGSNSSQFNVGKNNLKISLDNITEDIYVGNPVTFTAHLNVSITDKVYFQINFINYIVNINNTDTCNFTYIPQDNSTLTVMAIFAGNDEYKDSYSDILHFKVNKVSTEMDVNAEPINLGENAIVEIDLPGDAGGNLSVVVENKTYNAKVNGAVTYVLIENLSVGNYTANVSYSGDEKYLPISKTCEIIVYKANSTIDAKTTPIEVGENATIEITLSDDATGTVTANVNNKTYTATVNEGKANVTVSDLTIGDYLAEITYSGDDKYLPASTAVEIIVNKASNTPINASSNPVGPGENVVIEVNLPEDASGFAIAEINDNVYASKVTNGTAIIYGPVLEENTTAQITYLGDDKYSQVTTNISLVVENQLQIIAPDVVKYYGGSERFTVEVLFDGKAVSNKTVYITINGVTYTKTTDENGTTSMGLNLNSGNYTVNVKVDNIKVNSSVTIKPTVYADDLIKIFRNASQYCALFIDSEGNPLVNKDVTFNINGVMYKRTTDAMGWAKLNINLPQGTYIITATNPITGENKANNITVISKIESSDLVKTYKNESQFVVRLLADDGSYVGANEKVTFNINGVIYTKDTNSTGHALLNINLLPGEYIITSYYNNCAESNTITVLAPKD